MSGREHLPEHYSTLPPPIQTILTPDWYDAWEEYGQSVRATIEAERAIKAKADLEHQSRREQVRREQVAIRAEYRRNLDWLLKVITFDPQTVNAALGLTNWANRPRGRRQP